MDLIKRVVKKSLPFLISIGIGLGLIRVADFVERRQLAGALAGFETHSQALAALEEGDVKTAFELFALAATEFEDPRMRGFAIYEAANTGWFGQIADYQTLVDLYKYALRYDPDLYEAGFNLEYLYWLRFNSPSDIPQPEGDSGKTPGEEQDVPSGDI